MNPINFDQLKSQIEKAIETRLANGLINDPLGFILLDGFINVIYQKEIGNAFQIGGPTVPAVAVVGKSTGLIRTFALKVLLPHIEF